MFIVILCMVSISSVFGERLVLEAEEFEITKGDWESLLWRKDAYYASTFAITFHSRQRFLGAPEQGEESEAVMTIDVPKTDTYAVLARYEFPSDFAARFEICIEQNGKEVFKRMYGAIQNIKLWPFERGLQANVHWGWGSGDNVLWEGFDAKANLTQGKAKVILKKGKQPEPAARRHVDLVMISNEHEMLNERATSSKFGRYHPMDALLHQYGDMYLRVSSPKTEALLFVLEIYHREHSPHHKCHTGRETPYTWNVTKKGVWDQMLPNDDDTIWIQPGDKLDWMEIGSHLDALHFTDFHVKFVPKKVKDSGLSDKLEVTLEFGQKDEKGNIKVIREHKFSGSTHLVMPGDLRHSKEVLLPGEITENLRRIVASHKTVGKPPRKFNLYAYDEGILGEGINPNSPKISNLGDEISMPRIEVNDKLNNEFREYLKQKKLSPKDLGANDWPEVKADFSPECSKKNPRIFYHSTIFGSKKSVELLKQRTDDHIKKNPGVLGGYNYAPDYYLKPEIVKWVDVFKENASQICWSEDYVWQIPFFCVQVTGHQVDVFRCAAKYNNQPILFYIMPHSPGNTQKSFRLSAYEAIAHGAKFLHFYCAASGSGHDFTENYVSWYFPEMYKTIKEVVYEIGAMEDIVYPGKVRPAETALLLSHTTDIWNQTSAYNLERQGIYFSLRKAQVPVDFVTEEDIIDGILKNYKLLYITVDHLQQKCAEALEEWVKNGGVLVSVAGGGFWDEYNEPMKTLEDVYGVKAGDLHKQDEILFIKMCYDLPSIKAIDTITFQLPENEAACKIDSYCYKQQITVAEKNATIIGKFKDGSAAVVINKFGKGQAILIAGFPGTAYLKKAIPIRPFDRGMRKDSFCHFIPTDFDEEAARLIRYPTEIVGIRKNVICSEPLVESTVLESEAGMAVPLMNFSEKKLDALQVKIQKPIKFSSVDTVMGGKTTYTVDGDFIVLTLPLDLTDVVLLPR